MKCHNFDGDLYINIDINSFNQIQWTVPFDWMEVFDIDQIKLFEIKKLYAIIERVESVTLDQATKDHHLKIYLSEVYLKDQFEDLKAAPTKKVLKHSNTMEFLERDLRNQIRQLNELMLEGSL